MRPTCIAVLLVQHESRGALRASALPAQPASADAPDSVRRALQFMRRPSARPRIFEVLDRSILSRVYRVG